METITTPNFMRRIAKILAEVRQYSDFDAEALEELLKAELNEYSRMLDEYYIEEYSNAIASARNRAYDSGYEDGYSAGHSAGQSKE